MTFRGSYNHTIDDKGRCIIPAKFREVIETSGCNTLVLTQFDGCVQVYPLDAWKKIEFKINSLPETNRVMRRFKRMFIGNAFENSYDKQGRLLIPTKLKEYADLEKDVVLLGQLDNFEIWAREKYEKEEDLMEKDLQSLEVQNEIAQLGL